MQAIWATKDSSQCMNQLYAILLTSAVVPEACVRTTFVRPLLFSVTSTAPGMPAEDPQGLSYTSPAKIESAVLLSEKQALEVAILRL